MVTIFYVKRMGDVESILRMETCARLSMYTVDSFMIDHEVQLWAYIAYESELSPERWYFFHPNKSVWALVQEIRAPKILQMRKLVGAI